MTSGHMARYSLHKINSGAEEGQMGAKGEGGGMGGYGVPPSKSKTASFQGNGQRNNCSLVFLHMELS